MIHEAQEVRNSVSGVVRPDKGLGKLGLAVAQGERR